MFFLGSSVAEVHVFSIFCQSSSFSGERRRISHYFVFSSERERWSTSKRRRSVLNFAGTDDEKATPRNAEVQARSPGGRRGRNWRNDKIIVTDGTKITARINLSPVDWRDLNSRFLAFCASEETIFGISEITEILWAAMAFILTMRLAQIRWDFLGGMCRPTRQTCKSTFVACSYCNRLV